MILIVILRKSLAMLKVVAYVGLALMIYFNIIGPNGIAELFRVENPKQEGLKMIGLLLPAHVLYWTLGTVILEVLDNFLAVGEPINFKSKY